MNVRLEHVGAVSLRSIEVDLDGGGGLTHLFDWANQTVSQAVCHPDEEVFQGTDRNLECPGQGVQIRKKYPGMQISLHFMIVLVP
jgi:hypothetical protein